MSNPTPEERLKQLDDAISAVMIAGQEYRQEGRLVRRADLSTLQKMRQQLIAEIAEASGSNTAIAEFEGR